METETKGTTLPAWRRRCTPTRFTQTTPDSRSARRMVVIAVVYLFSLTATAPAISTDLTESQQSAIDSGRVQQVPSSPHEVTSKVCGTCHEQIYTEWRASMHSQSSALSDPIHEALYRNVMGDPRKEGVTNSSGKYPVCLQCHAPNAAMSKKTKLDAVASFDEGVSCIFCHTITSFNGTEKPDGKLQLGLQAYTVSTEALQSPSGRQFTTQPVAEGSDKVFHPFPMVAGDQALIKTDKLCLGCHDKRNNSKGVPLCVTGEEITASNTEVSCQSCHMPTTPTQGGHANHTMLGGHNADIVRRGILVTLDLASEGEQVVANLTLQNQLPHNFPTGAPFRNVVIELVALDEAGNEVWQSPEGNAFKEQSDSILVYRLGDGQGNPTMPPKALEVLSDTRLTPHETRTLSYFIPAGGVSTVKANLYYNLLWPNMAAQMTHLDEELRTPQLIATAVANL